MSEGIEILLKRLLDAEKRIASLKQALEVARDSLGELAFTANRCKTRPLEALDIIEKALAMIPETC